MRHDLKTDHTWNVGMRVKLYHSRIQTKTRRKAKYKKVAEKQQQIFFSIFLNSREASEDDCAVVDVPLPAYGRESCEIKQLSLGVYLYYPATFLLACNLLFFIVTSYRLCRLSRQTQLATKNLERHHQSYEHIRNNNNKNNHDNHLQPLLLLLWHPIPLAFFFSKLSFILLPFFQ